MIRFISCSPTQGYYMGVSNMTMFPHTVTVLNKVSSDDGVVYYPTVLKGVLYVTSRSSSRSTTGSDIKDDIKCTIPFKVGVSKPFISRLDYNKLSDEEKKGYWTLAKDDIIVKAEVTDTQISLKTIDRVYEDKMVVSFVDTLDFGALRHWQVGGA